jgi:hypothetical protein
VSESQSRCNAVSGSCRSFQVWRPCLSFAVQAFETCVHRPLHFYHQALIFLGARGTCITFLTRIQARAGQDSLHEDMIRLSHRFVRSRTRASVASTALFFSNPSAACRPGPTLRCPRCGHPQLPTMPHRIRRGAHAAESGREIHSGLPALTLHAWGADRGGPVRVWRALAHAGRRNNRFTGENKAGWGVKGPRPRSRPPNRRTSCSRRRRRRGG